MTQIPRIVKDQVTRETQRLCRLAKSHSGLTDSEIESKLTESGVVSNKNGFHFSELLNGKKSKAHGLFNFKKALIKEGLIPKDPLAGLIGDRAMMDKTDCPCDWQEEIKKIKAFNKASKAAAAAIREMANVLDRKYLDGSHLSGPYLEYFRVQRLGPQVTCESQWRELADWSTIHASPHTLVGTTRSYLRVVQKWCNRHRK